MRALVTGATGFMGQHLTKSLIEKGWTVGTATRHLPDHKILEFWYENIPYIEDELLCYMCDLVRTLDVKDMLEHFKPDIIFHLAANPLIKPNPERPNDIIQSNVVTTQNLCNFAPKGCRFIFASSIVVYGDKTVRCKEIEPCRPTSVYGATKLASEGIIHAHHSQNNIRGTSLRICATVGNGISHGIFYDLVRKLHSDDPYLEVLGDEPGSYKPFIYIDDVIQAFNMIVDVETNSVYNVTPETELSVLDIANLIMRVYNIYKPIKWLGSDANWKGDNKILKCSNQRLVYRDWRPKFSTSKEAVQKFLEGYQV